jgi:hypothetical protein
MDVVVEHDQHYEWEIVPAAQVKEGQYTLAESEGKAHARTSVDGPGSTSIHIPQDMIDRNVATGAVEVRTPLMFVRHHLVNSAMLHHADMDHWTKITVTGDAGVPEEGMTAALNMIFETDTPTADRVARTRAAKEATAAAAPVEPEEEEVAPDA